MLLTSDAARARAEVEKRAAAAAAARGVSETYTVRTLVAVTEGDTAGLQRALGDGTRLELELDLLGAYLGMFGLLCFEFGQGSDGWCRGFRGICLFAGRAHAFMRETIDMLRDTGTPQPPSHLGSTLRWLSASRHKVPGYGWELAPQ